MRGGRVSEWFMVPLSKSGAPEQGAAGSNPAPSATAGWRASLPHNCPHLEESHRGLVGATGNRVRRQRRRGFESHLLRHSRPD